jgi:FlaA1/EpsC-like NDP-sugar epimerase
VTPSLSISAAAYAGKCILITGAGGYIGSGLTLALAAAAPRLLVLLDNSEHHLHEIDLLLRERGDIPHAVLLGDICDAPLVEEILRRFQPELLLHAAACKHVPLMERNPLAAISTNTLGTWTLLQAAEHCAVQRFLLISTDKAVNPASVMGASKRVAEMALQRFSGKRLAAQSIRLGNVLGSSGSVGPLFSRQIASGGPVTVTHAAAERYFLSLDETVEMILAVAVLDAGIFIPKLTSATNIRDLAERMIREAPKRNGANISIAFTGLRPGDKMTEEFLNAEEISESTPDPRLSRVRGSHVPDEQFDALIWQLGVAVAQRNLGEALAVLQKFVPEYQPSTVLRELLNATRAAKA